MLEIIPFRALKDNYIWLIKNKKNDHIAIVDPGEATPLLHYIELEKLTPVAILITHHHWDHVGGITDITDQYDIPVYTPAKETVKGSTHPVDEGDVIQLDELETTLNIMHVPGHTLGALAYYDNEMVFSGDTLFASGCGRMFEGTAPQMHASLSRFKQLPGETKLYCGHEYTLANLRFAAAVEPDNKLIQKRINETLSLYEQQKPAVPSLLSIEFKTNPFLRCEEPSVMTAASEHHGKTLSDPAEVFAAVRKWKDDF